MNELLILRNIVIERMIKCDYSSEAYSTYWNVIREIDDRLNIIFDQMEEEGVPVTCCSNG